MRHYMAIGTVLRDEYAWSNVRLPPTTDSKGYDSTFGERKRWKEHQQRKESHYRGSSNAGHYHPPGHAYGPTRPSYAQTVVSETNHTLDDDVRAGANYKQPWRELLSPETDRVRLPTNRPSCQQQHDRTQQQQPALCRSLRVFAAWKA